MSPAQAGSSRRMPHATFNVKGTGIISDKKLRAPDLNLRLSTASTGVIVQEAIAMT
jgi:hypothetical protein